MATASGEAIRKQSVQLIPSNGFAKTDTTGGGVISSIGKEDPLEFSSSGFPWWLSGKEFACKGRRQGRRFGP